MLRLHCRATFLAAGAAIALTGCNAATLSTMNDRFDVLIANRTDVRAQIVKNLAADQGGTGNFDLLAKQSAIESELEKLANEAKTEASKATDKSTRIGFHFLRVRASFKAGVKEDEPFITGVVKDAKDACRDFDPNASQPARDCAFIGIVDSLAVIDYFVAEGTRLNKAKDDSRPTEKKKTDIETVITGIQKQFCKLERGEALVNARPVAPEFKTYFDLQQRRTIYNISLAIQTMDSIRDDAVRSAAANHLVRLAPLRSEVEVQGQATVLPGKAPLTKTKKIDYCRGVTVE